MTTEPNTTLPYNLLRCAPAVAHLQEAFSSILLGERIPLDVMNRATGEILIPANAKITVSLLRRMVACYDKLDIDPSGVTDVILEIVRNWEQTFAAELSEIRLLREQSSEYKRWIEVRERAESDDVQAQYEVAQMNLNSGV